MSGSWEKAARELYTTHSYLLTHPQRILLFLGLVYCPHSCTHLCISLQLLSVCTLTETHFTDKQINWYKILWDIAPVSLAIFPTREQGACIILPFNRFQVVFLYLLLCLSPQLSEYSAYDFANNAFKVSRLNSCSSAPRPLSLSPLPHHTHTLSLSPGRISWRTGAVE